MGDPTWTILIPTIGQREALFRRLLDRLLPQLDPYGGRVRVLSWWNNGEVRLWYIRDNLMAAAHHAGSEYISFIDDDDLVPAYYVDEVVAAIANRPDHVGFRLEYWVDGRFGEMVDHSLRHRGWGRSKEAGLYRDISHVDPIRTELAVRSSFYVMRAGRAEDRVWVRGVRKHVKTETYIDKVMYYYLWRSQGSAWIRPDLIKRHGFTRPAVDHPHFAWHPESGGAA